MPRLTSDAITIGNLRTRSSSTPGMQREQRERQRLERDQDAHLQRRRVEQQRGRQRQREIGDLRAERRDGQRQPQAAEIRQTPQAAEIAAGDAGNAFRQLHDASPAAQTRRGHRFQSGGSFENGELLPGCRIPPFPADIRAGVYCRTGMTAPPIPAPSIQRISEDGIGAQECAAMRVAFAQWRGVRFMAETCE